MTDSFDFRGLGSNPPPGLRVVDADEAHFHAVRTTTSGEKHFFIVRRGENFELHAQTRHLGPIGLESLSDASKLIVAAELSRALALLGYGRTRTPRPRKQRPAFPPAR